MPQSSRTSLGAPLAPHPGPGRPPTCHLVQLVLCSTPGACGFGPRGHKKVFNSFAHDQFGPSGVKLRDVFMRRVGDPGGASTAHRAPRAARFRRGGPSWHGKQIAEPRARRGLSFQTGRAGPPHLRRPSGRHPPHAAAISVERAQPPSGLSAAPAHQHARGAGRRRARRLGKSARVGRRDSVFSRAASLRPARHVGSKLPRHRERTASAPACGVSGRRAGQRLLRARPRAGGRGRPFAPRARLTAGAPGGTAPICVLAS